MIKKILVIYKNKKRKDIYNILLIADAQRKNTNNVKPLIRSIKSEIYITESVKSGFMVYTEYFLLGEDKINNYCSTITFYL